MPTNLLKELTDGQIRTFSGRAFSPLDPDPSDIDILDIAHALSLNCRFTGHTRFHYSVAQHSVLVASLVEDELRLTALLHDASEAYLSDIARPIKQQPAFGDVYKEFEGRLERAIAERFALTYPWPKAVKNADEIALVTEARDLMFGTAGWKEPLASIEPLQDLTIVQLTPEQAEEEFLTYYWEFNS